MDASYTLPKVRPLNAQVRERLKYALLAIGKHLPEHVQDIDSYEYRDNALVGEYDAHRGESTFMMDGYIARALKDEGFVQVPVPQSPLTEADHTVTHMFVSRSNLFVTITTEYSDHGKHRTHCVRIHAVESGFFS